MKQIIIIGGSLAGVRFAEDLRGVDQESSIKILLGDGNLPVVRSSLTAYLSGELTLEQILARPRDFYAQKNIELIFDKKLSRVNFRRSQIGFEDKSKLDYDQLLLTDTLATKLPEIKGIHRAGVFGWRTLADAAAVIKILPLAETVVVQSQTFLGLRLAAALRKKGKEVILATPENRILSTWADAQSSSVIKNVFQGSGVRVMEQNEIVEILGDTEVKAVRLKSGKVIAAQVVLWPDAPADMKIFKDTELPAQGKLAVNANFQTDISNVFAADDLIEGDSPCGKSSQDQYPAVLEEQGKTLAAGISGQGLIAEYPLAGFSVSIGDVSVRLLGDPAEKENTRVAVEYDEPNKKYKKIFVEREIVTGAVLVQADAEKEKFAELIRTRKNINEVPDRLWENLQYAANLEPAAGAPAVNTAPAPLG